MIKKICKYFLTFVSMVCIFCIAVMSVYAAPQGTDGTEMQIMEPEKLEIQFGTDWAGVEFQMKTDVGMYPGTITVGKDGVLRMEIGGSKSYVLSCMNSSVPIPERAQVPAITEEAREENQENSTAVTAEEYKGTTAGIPIIHIILFAGGMILAVGSLIVMQIIKKRREADDEYEEE